jgi:multimeric flavodoxin WrbA
MEGARAAGTETALITPWKLEIRPCLACEGCYRTGRCTIEDDFRTVYDLIVGAAGLVLATPVYFGGVSAQAKLLIDRCECFWALRYLLGKELPPSGQQRLGILIATAGRDLEIMYTGPRITFDFLMGACQGRIYAELLYGGLDEPWAIRNNREALDRAFEAGRSLAHELENNKGAR